MADIICFDVDFIVRIKCAKDDELYVDYLDSLTIRFLCGDLKCHSCVIAYWYITNQQHCWHLPISLYFLSIVDIGTTQRFFMRRRFASSCLFPHLFYPWPFFRTDPHWTGAACCDLPNVLVLPKLLNSFVCVQTAVPCECYLDSPVPLIYFFTFQQSSIFPVSHPTEWPWQKNIANRL